MIWLWCTHALSLCKLQGSFQIKTLFSLIERESAYEKPAKSHELHQPLLNKEWKNKTHTHTHATAYASRIHSLHFVLSNSFCFHVVQEINGPCNIWYRLSFLSGTSLFSVWLQCAFCHWPIIDEINVFFLDDESWKKSTEIREWIVTIDLCYRVNVNSGMDVNQ